MLLTQRRDSDDEAGTRAPSVLNTHTLGQVDDYATLDHLTHISAKHGAGRFNLIYILQCVVFLHVQQQITHMHKNVVYEEYDN